MDYALGCHAGAWLRHPVLGDPSFDTFVRAAGNPVLRGTPPHEWPVNAFLLIDPRTGHWFAYVGCYPRGYACGPGVAKSQNLVFRSEDRGRTWTRIGPTFAGDFAFAGDEVGANSAPDVSVVFENGRYHLAYDWGHDDATWDSVFRPDQRRRDSGLGYAWSDRPEGPFHRHLVPILRNGEHRSPVSGKYGRLYAPTLVRRRADWLLLVLADSGARFAWGLYAMTARDPAGAWAAPRLVLSLESPEYHPALMEFYPAFVRRDVVYGPATSVALNRQFQCMWRAELEAAHLPEAWSLHQHGTAWHAEGREDEHWGIWGQTFSGQVDPRDELVALFPSRDEAGCGTIGVATRPWLRPLRERGFALGGCAGPALALLRRAWESFSLQAEVKVVGRAALCWGWQGWIGPDRHGADATLPAGARGCGPALEFDQTGWRIVAVGAAGNTECVGVGDWPGPGPRRDFELTVNAAGSWTLCAGGERLGAGEIAGRAAGPIGLWLEPDSRLAVERFEIEGPGQPAVFLHHWLDAFLATGVHEEEWERRQGAPWRSGGGAVSRASGARLKWNFAGTGVRWWAPRGPEFGRVEVWLDGEFRGVVDLWAAAPEASVPVFVAEGMGDGFHALSLVGLSGRLPADALEAVGP